MLKFVLSELIVTFLLFIFITTIEYENLAKIGKKLEPLGISNQRMKKYKSDVLPLGYSRHIRNARKRNISLRRTCVQTIKSVRERVLAELDSTEKQIDPIDGTTVKNFIQTIYKLSGGTGITEVLEKNYFKKPEGNLPSVWDNLWTTFQNYFEYYNQGMPDVFKIVEKLDQRFKLESLKDDKKTLSLLEPIDQIIEKMKNIKSNYSEEHKHQKVGDIKSMNYTHFLSRLEFMKKLPSRIEEMQSLTKFIKNPAALSSNFFKSGLIPRLHFINILAKFLKGVDNQLRSSTNWGYILPAITTLIGNDDSRKNIEKLQNRIDELRNQYQFKEYFGSKPENGTFETFEKLNYCIHAAHDYVLPELNEIIENFRKLKLEAISSGNLGTEMGFIDVALKLFASLTTMNTEIKRISKPIKDPNANDMVKFYLKIKPMLKGKGNDSHDVPNAILYAGKLIYSTVKAGYLESDYEKIRGAIEREKSRNNNTETNDFAYRNCSNLDTDKIWTVLRRIPDSWKMERAVRSTQKFVPDFTAFNETYKRFKGSHDTKTLANLINILNRANENYNFYLIDFKKSDEITKLKSGIGGAQQANIREAVKKVVSFMKVFFKNRSLREDINFWEDSNVYALFRNKNNTEKWFQKFEKMMPSGKDEELIGTNQIADGLKNMKQLQAYINDVFKFLENDYDCSLKPDSESTHCSGFKSLDWAVETPNYGRYVKKNEEDKEKIYSKRVQSFEEYSSIHLSEFENENPIAFIITLTIGIIGILSVFSVSMWLSIRVFLGARLNRSFMSKVECNFTPFEHEDDEEPNPFFVGCNEEYLMIETDYDGMKFVDKDRFKKKIKSQYPLFEKTLLVLNKNPYPATIIEVSKFKTYIATEIPNLQNSEMFIDILLKQPANVAIQISGPDEYFMDFTKYVNHGKYHVQAIPKHTEIEGMNRFVLVISDQDGESGPVLVHFFHIYCWSEIQETDIISTILDTIEWSLEVHLPHYSTVVCCKNGSGRTMTFITCIQLRILIDEHKFARFSNEVMRMRKQRFGSVDNVSQFAIIWMVTLLWRARLDLNRYGDVYLRLQKLYENDLDLLAEESAAGPCEDLILKDD